MKKKIIVSAFSNLYTDQRIEKMCKTLSEMGFEILLIGNNWKGNEAVKRPYYVYKIPIQSRILKLAYLEFQIKLFFLLWKKQKKETILFANDLDALLPNFLISKIFNSPLVFDSHEIFTEMPSVQGKLSQKIWRILERLLLPKIKFFITMGECYAQWFVDRYHIKRPVIVHNFPFRISSLPQNIEKNGIILYQGVLDNYRGLEYLIESMQYLPEYKLWICGDGLIKSDLAAKAKELKLENNIIFWGKVSSSELKNYTLHASLGVSIEENKGLSYYYSLPNKLCDYIQARVPVVVSPFPEMKKVVERYKVGEMIENHDPKHIADKIRQTIKNRDISYYQEGLDKAADDLCWENEVPKIKKLFNELMTCHK